MPRAMLFDPTADRDACGIGFVVRSRTSREITDAVLEGPASVKHRGNVARIEDGHTLHSGGEPEELATVEAPA